MKSEAPVLRTYEEIEKNRQVAMGLRSGSRRFISVLLVMFFGFAGVTIYLLAVPWTGLVPADYSLAEVTSVVAAVFLFAARLLARRPGRSLFGSSVLALSDTLAFVGLLALSAWTLVFPLLHPFPSEIVVVGMFSLILTTGLVAVLRFVQPSVSVKQERVYADVEASLRQLGDAVDELSRRLPQAERKADPALVERLSTMTGEIAAMRKEFATLKSFAPAASAQGYASSSVSGVRAAPEVRPSKWSAVGPVKVVHASKDAPRDLVLGPAVPDSTLDNPWLDVLTRRKSRRPSNQPG